MLREWIKLFKRWKGKLLVKQAIIVRSDIKMGKGKACAQVAHASLMAYEMAKRLFPEKVERWRREGAKKVVLKAPLKVIMEKLEEAKREGLAYALIRDAGLTQVEPGSITALAIGPDEEERIDKICGMLKLY